MDTPPVMQRRDERSRLVVNGQRTDDQQTCTLVVVHEIGDRWVLYPHGASKFGVRLDRTEAVRMARTILAETQ